MFSNFLYHYQPIVCLNSLDLVRYEALLRNPSGQDTQRTISDLEDSGGIIELDLHTLESVINDLNKDRRFKSTPVAVNISALSISNTSFQNEALSILWNRPAHVNISLEITETKPILNLILAKRFTDRVHAAGCSIGMDDYGDGYSHLNLVDELGLDYLKISSTLTKEVLHSEYARSKIEELASLSRIKGLDIIAEHIDSYDQYLWLKKIGINYGQGWLFAKAGEPIDDVRITLPNLQ